MPPTSRRIPNPIRRHRTLYLASAGLLAVALFFLFAGHLLASAGQNPSSADLICILGGDLGERSDKGLALYRRGFAPRLLFTGMLACTGREENCYDDPMVKKVLDAGVPRAAIFFDAASTSSWEDAHNTRRIMNAHNWKGENKGARLL